MTLLTTPVTIRCTKCGQEFWDAHVCDQDVKPVSKAQELAKLLEHIGRYSHREAAAELRRLEAENARLKTVPMKYRRMAFNAELQSMNDKLMADKAELLEALAAASVALRTGHNTLIALEKAGVSIQKHGGQA